MKLGRLIKRLALLGMASYIAILLNGCAENKLDDVWESSLKGCAINCHSPDGTESAGPDMSTADKFFDNVVGKSTADYDNWTITSDCDSLQMIKPGDADNSSLVAGLVKSVSDAQACDTAFNTHMALSVTNSDMPWTDLVNWINEGANKE